MEKIYYFSSESVCEGHPDKVADQISDAILDAHLSQDPTARVACNTLAAKDLLIIAGEITSSTPVSYEEVARRKLREIGYIDSSCGLDGNNCSIITSISRQSGNIAQGVDRGDGELGAGLAHEAKGPRRRRYVYSAQALLRSTPRHRVIPGVPQIGRS